MGLPYSDLQGKVITQGLDVAAQRIEGVGIVASFLDPSHLGLRNSEAFGNFDLGESRCLAGVRKLEPKVHLGGFLLIDGLILGIPV